MASEFANNFLDRMIRETSDEPQKEATRAELIRVTRDVPVQRTQSKPKPRPIPQPKEEPVEEEFGTVEKKVEEEQLEEDFVEKALNYASVVMRTVKKTFESSKEREIVLEALYSTLKLHFKTKGRELVEETTTHRAAPVHSVGVASQLSPQSTAPVKQIDKTNLHPGGTMSERDWMKIPTISYTDYETFDPAAVEAEAGKEEARIVAPQPIAPTPAVRKSSETYDPKQVAAPIVVNNDGLPTLDVNSMSQESIHALRVLAGIE
jgi:hypothetical protein